MPRLLIRPHSVYVAPLPDRYKRMDTREHRDALLSALPAGNGVFYSAYEGHPAPRLILDGVAILDAECGVLYEVLAERRESVPVLTRKTVVPMGRDSLADVATLPDSLLANLACDYLEHPEETEPFEGAELDFGEAGARRKIRPALSRIARLVNDQMDAHRAARAGTLTREELATLAPRKWLAARFGVSVQTADRWIAQARSAGLVPPATVAPGSAGRGRPRKHAATTKAGA